MSCEEKGSLIKNAESGKPEGIKPPRKPKDRGWNQMILSTIYVKTGWSGSGHGEVDGTCWCGQIPAGA